MKPLAATILSLSLFASGAAAQDSQHIGITRSGSRPARAGPADNFTGSVRVAPLFDTTASTRATGASVSFAPGARSAWHTHRRGQVLIVTAGVGRVQRWGSAIEEIRPGDVVWIPPRVKHWHGAATVTAMTHIAIVEQLDGRSTDWMEKVSDAQYSTPVRERPSSVAAARHAADGAQPTPAQRLIGDLSPKLVELTDEVLFGDVWARPQLAQRDRSLVTVSALIAMNRPDQLRSHLARARDNGVTQEELIETITHLAFYAGWPSAMTAIGVAKDVFQSK
jgi:4-carboxymuconolactone decarboxylase